MTKKTDKEQATEKKSVGRPRGYSPGLKRETTHSSGAWEWNTNFLHAKVVKGKKADCWAWTGAITPYGNVIGAYKNGKNQMTQPNRLLAHELYGMPLDENHTVKMSCFNRYCCNHNHFFIREKQPK
jgi:hypothetical protein